MTEKILTFRSRIASSTETKFCQGWMAVLLLLTGLSGCGYALVGRGSNLPEDIQSVYIEPLTSRSNKALVEQILGTAIAEEMVLRQRFELASNEADSDAVLEGEILSVRLTPITFGGAGFATEYEISVRAFILLRRTDEEETILWANPEYDFRENYELDLEGDTGIFEREVTAIEDISSKFARSLISDLLEGF